MTDRRVAFALVVALAAGCGGDSPTDPAPMLPLVSETATMRYYHAPGDSIDIARQEAFNAWALDILQVSLPQKVEYRKYTSREDMGRYTGRTNTNGFAEPEAWRFHTIWPFDNHEVVHVFTAVLGRPSDFFNEGIAVALQTDPARGDYSVRFNGQQPHSACGAYLQQGVLPLPLSNYVTTAGFRSISDDVLSYRMAGSVMLHMVQRFGLSRVLQFFRTTARDETVAAIDARLRAVFGASLEDIENSWLTMLRTGQSVGSP